MMFNFPTCFYLYCRSKVNTSFHKMKRLPRKLEKLILKGSFNFQLIMELILYLFYLGTKTNILFNSWVTSQSFKLAFPTIPNSDGPCIFKYIGGHGSCHLVVHIYYIYCLILELTYSSFVKHV